MHIPCLSDLSVLNTPLVGSGVVVCRWQGSPLRPLRPQRFSVVSVGKSTAEDAEDAEERRDCESGTPMTSLPACVVNIGPLEDNSTSIAESKHYLVEKTQ